MTRWRTCADPYCPESVPVGTSYCGEHLRENRRNHTRARRRGGTTGWEQSALKRRVLREEPFCRMGCRRLSERLEHVVPIQWGGSANDRANLAGFCTECATDKDRCEARGETVVIPERDSGSLHRTR